MNSTEGTSATAVGGSGLSEGLGPDGILHADGYFTWRRDGYVLDEMLPAAFVLLKVARERLAALEAENTALKREAHTWSKAAEAYAKPRAPLTRQQIDDVMTQHYPLSSLVREEVDAFEACVRDLERLHGIGA